MNPKMVSLLITLLTSGGALSALLGNTLTVTNTDDSGAGSLRQALLDSNASVGVLDMIAFNIAGTGVQTISPVSPLPAITDPVVIDAYTQPGAAENTDPDAFNGMLLIELNGADAGTDVTGLTITAGDSTIRGLVINRFDENGIRLESANNIVEGNFVGTNASGTGSLGNSNNGVQIADAPDNTVGGTTPAARNILSGNNENGVSIFGSDATGNLVQGNLIGTDATGTDGLGNTAVGVYLFAAPFNTIGGAVAGARNVISANGVHGVVLDEEGGGNLVQGNFIGTDVTGNVALGNSEVGVVIQNAGTNTIGGSEASAANVISGNGDDGIFISGVLSGATTVVGNFIGTQANGIDPLGNANDGIELSSSDPVSFVFIVGPPANVIAFNGARGVFVSGGTGNLIFGNSIFSNGGLGIDLGDSGVTPNDAGDGDDGPNGLQNFPLLTSAMRSGGKTTIQGTLNSTPNSTFLLHFYVSSAADPSGNGEGQTYLGVQDVTTDDGGNVTFSADLDALAPMGQAVVSATATDGFHNTSEFSQTVELVNLASRLLNISTRLNVQTGDNVLIGGFIITGAETAVKKVMVRAIGPSLAGAGLSGALEDPVLELHEPDGTVVTNDNWRDTQEQEITDTAIAPTDDLESAIVADLKPGAYTAVMRGKDGGAGVGLIEAYDLDQATPSQLANMSSRGFIQTGDDVMIGGFISGGGGNGPSSFLIRALGPSLESAGVANALEDPTLEVRDENGTFIIANDDWRLVQEDLIKQTGIPPTDDRESAVVWILAPGAYTAIMRGKNDTIGVGLVEIYNLQ